MSGAVATPPVIGSYGYVESAYFADIRTAPSRRYEVTDQGVPTPNRIYTPVTDNDWQLQDVKKLLSTIEDIKGSTFRHGSVDALRGKFDSCLQSFGADKMTLVAKIKYEELIRAFSPLNADKVHAEFVASKNCFFIILGWKDRIRLMTTTYLFGSNQKVHYSLRVDGKLLKQSILSPEILGKHIGRVLELVFSSRSDA